MPPLKGLTHLRTLDLCGKLSSVAPAFEHWVTSLPSLSSISLVSSQLMPALFPSLTAIDFASLSLGTELTTLNAPQLREVTISVNTKRAQDFVRRHASQLTSLAVAGAERFDLGASNAPLFPALRELNLTWGSFVTNEELLGSFLRHAPSLTSLRNGGDIRSPELWERCAPLLTHVMNARYAPRPLPRLREYFDRLSPSHSSGAQMHARLAAIAPSVQKLSLAVNGAVDVTELFSLPPISFPHLKVLDASHPLAYRMLLEWKLPALREVSVWDEESLPVQFMEKLFASRERLPNLTHFYVVARDVGACTKPEMSAVIDKAEAFGLHCLKLETCDARLFELVAPRERKWIAVELFVDERTQ